MRLQKSTRFALYAVLELASAPERYLSASEVAAKYELSLHHLQKVLRILGRSGLIEGSRGVGGGYRFIGNAKRTTLLDVVRQFEDIDPITAGEREPGDATDAGTVLKGILEEIEHTALATLNSISLDTMIKLTRKHSERRAKDTAQRQLAIPAP